MTTPVLNNNKKKKRKYIIFSILACVVVAVVIVILVKGSKDEVISVQTEKISRRNITQTVTATGKVDPEFKVVITPEVTGEIVQLPVKEGDYVKKGTLLVKIKQDVYLAAKQRALANLQSAKSSLAQRKAELDKLTSDYNRVKELHAKKLSSDAELENAKSLFLSGKAQVESAVAFVDQNDANVKEAVEQLYKTTIFAPIDGIVTQLNVELGERVLGSGFSQGTNIMTVADLSKMVAIVNVDENDIVLIKSGDTAKVKVDAFGDKKFVGTVYQIGNSAKQTGTGTQDQVINFEVRIRLNDPDKKLRPGMSCNAIIETNTKTNVLSVPIPSVTARQEIPHMVETDEAVKVSDLKKKDDKPQEIVFIVDNNKAKAVPVKTGISDDNYIEILSGVKGSEEVISGSYRAISKDLHDGAIIKVDSKNMGDKKKEEKK
ncbi:MAG: efflux RND transporter periplasmic adaptor subunit [Ignavibacteria bacterium]|nr:efflux RND transporter periplasmic adaptor subunit [Ignavibacteria bacterium]